MSNRKPMPVQKFDILSEESRKSPQRLYEKLHAAGPVVYSALPLIGQAWLFTNYDACSEMLRDQDLYARDPAKAGRKFVADFLRFMPRGIKSLSKNMMSVDGEEHSRLRSLVEQAFRKQTVEEMRPRLVEHCGRILDDLSRKTDRNGVVDIVPHFARIFPLEVISELLGLPESDRPNFAKLGLRLANVRSLPGLLRASTGLWSLRNFLKKAIDKCRKSPRPGLLSAMIAAEQAGDKLSSDELLAMSFLLLLAGHETTSHLISTTVGTLLQSPDQFETLRNDWSLATGAVEEILRFVSPIQISKPRMITRDCERYDQELRRGQYAIAMIGAANHDPAKFDQPHVFNILRHPNPHLSFGAGIHTCLGLKLARAETEIALQQLITRYPDLNLYGQLDWSGRVGMRTLDSLEVRLNSD